MVCYDGGSNDYGGIVFIQIMITMVGGIGDNGGDANNYTV